MANESSKELDPISPAHYKQGKIEPIEFIESQNMGFHEANCIKYLTRWKYKNGIEDLRKARFYLERLISISEASERALK